MGTSRMQVDPAKKRCLQSRTLIASASQYGPAAWLYLWLSSPCASP